MIAPVIVLSLLIAGLLFAPDFIDPYRKTSFSPSVWVSNYDARMAMAQDLVEAHLRPGMTEQEITQLLGPPEAVIRGTSPGGMELPGDHSWSYWIGSDPFGKGDDVFVYIHFDAQGKVVGKVIHGY